MPPSRFAQSVAFLLGAIALGACDRAPSAEGLREWSAADHDRKDENARVATGQQSTGARDAAAAGLGELAWRNQCASCHGMLGRGDGPQGQMVNATDLSNPQWQARVTNQDIATAIRQGKGRMPKFDLPDEVVTSLVEQVRAFRMPASGR